MGGLRRVTPTLLLPRCAGCDLRRLTTLLLGPGCGLRRATTSLLGPDRSRRLHAQAYLLLAGSGIGIGLPPPRLVGPAGADSELRKANTCL